MQNFEQRLTKLENEAAAVKTATPLTPCICPFREQHFFFIFEGIPEAQIAALHPGNTKHCKKCGGLNQPVYLPNDEFESFGDI